MPRALPTSTSTTLTAAQGFRIFGADAGDQSGCSVSSAGDLNGDGFDDLIVGAHTPTRPATPRPRGESTVIFGRDFTGGVVFAGTAAADTFTGTAAAETFVGGQGDDTLIGNGGADSFQGGAGNDSIVVGGALPLDLDGGSGIDTVNLDATGGTIDLSGLGSSRFARIEKIDLTGSRSQHARSRPAGRARHGGQQRRCLRRQHAPDQGRRRRPRHAAGRLDGRRDGEQSVSARPAATSPTPMARRGC